MNYGDKIKIELPYDKSHIIVEIEEKRISAILATGQAFEGINKPEEEIIEDALLSPISSAPLFELAQKADNVLIVTSDHTRPVPSKITIPLLVREIRRGNRNASIKILIATGCHRPSNKKELLYKFGRNILDSFEIISHNCDGEMQHKGTLSSGNEFWVNKLTDWADFIIAEGFIEPHFFAGYSGGRKSILPGIASRKTVMENHCAEFIGSPYAKTGSLNKNPIHMDMMEAANLAGLGFILNVVVGKGNKTIKAFAGDPEKAHMLGCEYVEKACKVEPVKSDIVITTNGGYPLDQNIYQAVKGMAAAASCAKKGGVIIIAASCKNGHGGGHFFDFFSKADNPAQILSHIKSIPREKTAPDQWQAQILAGILQEFKVIVVSEKKAAKLIEKMHMFHAPSIEKALDFADLLIGPDKKVTIIPDGIRVIAI